MAAVERVGHCAHFDRELFVLEVANPQDVPKEWPLPARYCACLVAWDATQATEAVIGGLVRQLLQIGCVYGCFWGGDCSRVHDLFDLAELEVVPEEPHIMSSWHENETLRAALWFVLFCSTPDDEYFDGCKATVAISIGSPEWAMEMRTAFADPEGFSDRWLSGNP
jgi:hypothetical protein